MKRKDPRQGSLFDGGGVPPKQKTKICICGHREDQHRKDGRICLVARCRCPLFEFDKEEN